MACATPRPRRRLIVPHRRIGRPGRSDRSVDRLDQRNAAGGNVPEPSDREARPLRADLRCPGRSALQDRHCPTMNLKLDPNLVAQVARDALIAVALDPGEVELGEDSLVLTGRGLSRLCQVASRAANRSPSQVDLDSLCSWRRRPRRPSRIDRARHEGETRHSDPPRLSRCTAIVSQPQ